MTKSKGIKRNNGEGSISRYGEGWRYQYSVDVDGTPKRKSAYAKTEKEILEKKRQVDKEIANQTYSDSKLTITSLLTDFLIYKKRTIEVTTYGEYNRCIKELNSRIGKEKITKLQPRKIQTVLNDIQDAKGAACASKCRTILSSAYKWAIRNREAVINPVDATDTVKQPTREMILWEAPQAVRFLETALSHRLYALFYLALSTGLRRAELLGLKYEDIKGNTLHIRQTLVRTHDGKPLLKQPKSTKSYRTVTVTDDVLDVLTAYRQRQEAEKQNAGTLWAETLTPLVTKGGTVEKSEVPNTFVFTSEVGSFIDFDTLRTIRLKLMDEAGVPRIRLHDYRHLHISILISAGYDPKTVSDRAGHFSPSFTLSRYSHQFESQKTKAIGIAGWLNPTPKVSN